ncbi:class I SAM-dependent methyltransferase [Octadecabacter antarcticus]|uniref:class I SAM-dependent methyltransferase n=1 Tax=Octadecabacter antarcticus TaxID=1217908 RepID=UPI000180732C|nr:class I SAM-dependent methyltransferase [Octadecabacter antarcticus]
MRWFDYGACHGRCTTRPASTQRRHDSPISPADIITTYDRVAADYQSQRNRSLFEKPILDSMLGITPHNVSLRHLLDLVCGPGAPIATCLAKRGMAMTGGDGTAAMVDLFAQTLPNATAVHADMRTLDLGEKFDAILARNTLFPSKPNRPAGDVCNLCRPSCPQSLIDVHIRSLRQRCLGPGHRRTRLSHQP